MVLFRTLHREKSAVYKSASPPLAYLLSCPLSLTLPLSFSNFSSVVQRLCYLYSMCDRVPHLTNRGRLEDITKSLVRAFDVVRGMREQEREGGKEEGWNIAW